MAEIQVVGVTIEADSVVVKGADFDALCAAARESRRLTQELSLAEEGLANYAQENGRMRAALEETLSELQLADARHDLMAKIILALRSREPQSAEQSPKARRMCTECGHEEGYHFDNGHDMVVCRYTANCKCKYPLETLDRDRSR